MTFCILIELPPIVKKELLRICSGLPSAEWQSEENLYIILRHFKKLTDVERWDLTDSLGEIEISSFPMSIRSLQYIPQRNNSGTIIASPKLSLEFNNLKQKIESQLRSFHSLASENHPSNDSVIRLGTVKRESQDRLANYFEAFGDFESSTFEVTEFVFARLYQTEKHSFYTVEKRFFLK